MHLGADAVNLGHSVSFPFLNPVDQALHLLVVIPIGLQVVVVDEQHDILGTILAGQSAGLAHILQVAHVVLPVEGIAAHIPCGIRIAIGVIALRVLQDIVSRAIVTITTDSLVHQIPSLHLAAAGFHHALNPLVHCIDEGVVTLLCGLGNSMSLIALKLDALDIDIANVVRNMQQHEVAVHGRCDGHLYILPFRGEGDAEVSTAIPVANASVELA